MFMQHFLNALQFPAAFVGNDSDPPDRAGIITAFKAEAVVHLESLHHALQLETGELSTAELAKVVATVVPFTNENWVSESARTIAHDILATLPPPRVEMLQDILLNYVRPAFAKTPHPSLNLSTGRTLPRPIGGASGTHGLYDEQPWKQRPGLPAVVLWCTAHIEPSDYEQLWHLLIPPMMTFLDDYETVFKIWGLRVSSCLVERVSSTLLRRTGIGLLLDKTISQTFYHLHNPETPMLLRQCIPTYLSLVDKLTERDSSDRLNKLFDLLGKNIIGGIWIYSSQDAETIEATVDALPLIIRALGIATTRYLKALIPQLLYPLTANIHHKASPNLYLSSIQAMLTLMDICYPRIHGWSEVILTAICRGWVQCVDHPGRIGCDAIKESLRVLLGKLVEICTTVRQDVRRIYDADKDMFRPLFSQVLLSRNVTK